MAATMNYGRGRIPDGHPDYHEFAMDDVVRIDRFMDEHGVTRSAICRRACVPICTISQVCTRLATFGHARIHKDKWAAIESVLDGETEEP